jgi:hypothetical protein
VAKPPQPRSSKIEILYRLLVDDAPEAAIGVGAVAIGAPLITATELISKDPDAHLVLLLFGSLFLAIGVVGFVVSMIRVSRR